MSKKVNSLISLEEHFLILINDIKPLLKQFVSKPNKWFLDSENQQVLKTIEKRSFSFDQNTIKNKMSYEKCKEAFEKDILKQATKLAGYRGKFDTILYSVVNESARIKRGKIFIDENQARQKIREIRSQFSQKKLKFQAHARILGVIIKRKKIEMPDGLCLYRLNKKEINARQPLIEAFYTNALWTDPQITFHPTEIRHSMGLSIDTSKDFAFFEATNKATQEARNAFQNLIESILLVKEGDVQLGPFAMEGGPVQSGISYNSTTRLIPFPEVVISNAQAKQLVKIYNLLTGDERGKDKVLKQALKRFFIGRNRHDPVDKLINYVISWETILLTSKGSPIKQEQNYRFSLNSSSLLSSVYKNKKKKEYFVKMKCAYAIRSTIVHGGSDKETKKQLKSGDFLDLNNVCQFLENNFRKTVWWLIDIDRSKRPYYDEYGWENLLWTI